MWDATIALNILLLVLLTIRVHRLEKIVSKGTEIDDKMSRILEKTTNRVREINTLLTSIVPPDNDRPSIH